MAFEYLLQTYDESNACLLFLKILANNFPNTSPAQNLSRSGGSLQEDKKSKERAVNLDFLKRKSEENRYSFPSCDFLLSPAFS